MSSDQKHFGDKPTLKTVLGNLDLKFMCIVLEELIKKN